MFRLYRKTICRRWHGNYKNSFEKNSRDIKPKLSVLCIHSDKQNHSNNSHKKQHANKQDKRCWDDPHFQFHFFKASIFETAGWLGTVAVCLNYHVKSINSVLEYEKNNSSCLFSNIVRALPRRHIENEKTPHLVSLPRQPIKNEKIQLLEPKQHIEHDKPHSSVFVPTVYDKNEETDLVVSDLFSPGIATCKLEKDKVSEDADILGENIKALSEKYSVAIENSVGVRNINKNDKKAFRSFQNAARHGSTAGFYNLGLCYQLGKGTRVNLHRAAYCYRKAAMKGHGLASFNLAVFFHKGIGGLPVDPKIAKELLAEAAEKNVPEAQLYFGILFLEEKKWSDAVRIFSDLAEKNVPDAQYYLGLCYENGLGVQKSEKVASELFKKSAQQGNKKATDKLKNIKKVHCDTPPSLFITNVCKGAENSSLHPSMSVPELSAVVKRSNQSLLKLPILSYLNLFTPLLIVNSTSKIKDNFYSNEKLTKEYSSTYISCKPLPSVVVAVKSEL